MDNFSELLGKIAFKVDQNKYLTAIKQTFTIYMPFVIAGSFATLFNALLSSTETGLAQFSALSWLENLGPAFNAMSFTTLNIMALAITVILGAVLGKNNKINPITGSVIALSSYIAVVPQGIETVIDGAEQLVAGLPVETINASGLFIGMIIAIISVELFSGLSKQENLRINMPESVPKVITDFFNALIPTIIILLIFSIFGKLFNVLTGEYLNEFIYSIIQSPLEIMVQTPVGIILLVVVAQLFWAVGIHGGLVVSPIRNRLLIAALAANIEAVNNGLDPSRTVTLGFWTAFMVPGGAGLTLSLMIAIFIFSKNEESKAISKISFIPALFGISEPIVFGLPLVLNPIYFIPFAFSSGIATAIGLFFSSIGFITPNVVDVPFGLPIGVSAFLGWGWQGVIVQLIILFVGVLIYVPFVLAENRVKVEN